MSEAAQPKPATLASETPLLHKFPPLFKNRNFLLLWAGYVVSALGDRIHFLVMLKLLENLKHAVDPLHKIGTQETAQLNIMMLLPFLALGPITGVIADRLPRRLVMISADFARVLVVVAARTLFLTVPANSPLHQAVPWFPEISYVILMLLISELVIATFSAFFSPARTALLPNLVHPDQLLRANSMTNAAGTIASLVGFIIGAALVSWHLKIAMYVDAATFLCSGVLLLMMSKTSHISAAAVSKEKRTGFVSEFVDGLRYLKQHKRAMQIILLMFLFWCAGAIILSGLTGVVTHKFNKDVAWFGYFLGYVGIGMMAGAGSVSIARRGVPKEIGIAWSMVFVGVFFFLFSIPQHWQLALVFLIVCGFFGAVLLVSLDTLLQRIVPDFIRGRVMAMRDMLANVGLVGVAVPLAFDPHIDRYIITILRIVAVVIVLVGMVLVVIYYQSQYISVGRSIVLRFVRGYLTIFKRFDRGNAARIPVEGPVIFVANHSTAYDPLLLQAASKHRMIQFMMAKEYYEKKPMLWLYKWFKVIPVNRSGNDTTSIRTAIRALKEGACIGMFPEGRISDDGRMNEGRPGVAMLALISGATVVPAYIRGTRPYQGMLKDFLSFDRITIFFGTPLRFDDLTGHKEEARDEATGRIMNAIRALRARYETNPDRLLPSVSKPARADGG